ncbi:hypothetical protein SUGI_1111790, partial [Cryptomeria japonica]
QKEASYRVFLKTHSEILSQFTMTMEIPKERFMKLLDEVLAIIHKSEIKFAEFWPHDVRKPDEKFSKFQNKYIKIHKYEWLFEDDNDQTINLEIPADMEIQNQNYNKDDSRLAVSPPVGTFACPPTGKVATRNVAENIYVETSLL